MRSARNTKGADAGETQPLITSDIDNSNMAVSGSTTVWTDTLNANTKKVYKNTVILGIAFAINFTAYTSVQTLQSSINLEEGLGTTGLAVLYSSFIISNLLLPKFCIRHFGCNKTIAVSFLGYGASSAANIYATWWTIIPGSIITGLAAGPLWTAQATYVTQLARSHSRQVGEKCDVVVNRLFALFFTIFQFNAIGGNVASSILFAPSDNDNVDVSVADLRKCGKMFCYATYNATNDNLDRPPVYTIQILMGVYICLNILAAVLVYFCLGAIEYDNHADISKQKLNKETYRSEKSLLRDTYSPKSKSSRKSLGYDVYGQYKVGSEKDDTEDHVEVKISHDDSSSVRNSKHDISDLRQKSLDISKKFDTDAKQSKTERFRPELLIATVDLLRDYRTLLTIPLLLADGMICGFASGDFLQAYVGCYKGIYMVGYVTMVMGVLGGVVTVIVGKLKFMGRAGALALGIYMYASTLILSLVWQPLDDDLYVFFVIGGLFGGGRAALQVGCSALIGSVFIDNNEAAFGNLKLWQSVGTTISFAYSTALCMFVKLYIMLAILVVGAACCVVLELKQRRTTTYRIYDRL